MHTIAAPLSDGTVRAVNQRETVRSGIQTRHANLRYNYQMVPKDVYRLARCEVIHGLVVDMI